MGKRIVKGIVVSTKMDKTITVKVELSKKHARYGKRYIVHTKLKAHCKDKGSISEGDIVSIVEIAPVSKTKHWELKEIHKSSRKVK